jgi:uncharacterized membrane protein HdeD (DUF308 family)
MDRFNAWMLRSPWVLDVVRGVLSLLFGLALWLSYTQALTSGVLALGVYLLGYGRFDIRLWYLTRRAGDRGWSRLWMGVLSVSFALAIFVLTVFAFTIVVIYFGMRMIVHGALDLYHFMARATSAPDLEPNLDSHPTKRLLWLTELGQILVRLLTIVVSIVVSIVVAIYLGLSYLFDGVTFLFTAAVKARLLPDRPLGPTDQGKTISGDAAAEGLRLRALAFVRPGGPWEGGMLGGRSSGPTAGSTVVPSRTGRAPPTRLPARLTFGRPIPKIPWRRWSSSVPATTSTRCVASPIHTQRTRGLRSYGSA